MNMNQDYQDRIDQYLLDQMSQKERQDFERDMEKDKELMEQFEFTKNVKAAIVGRNRRFAQIREWEQAYEAKKKETDNTRSAKRIHLLYWISGIAAVFIVGFFLFLPTKVSKDEQLNDLIPSGHGKLRNSVSEDNTSIEQALRDGDFSSALAKIEEEKQKLEIEKTQTEQDKNDMDVEEYSYLQEVYIIKADELNLLKVSALIGLKRIHEALVILGELRNREGPFKTQADSLYNLYKK